MDARVISIPSSKGIDRWLCSASGAGRLRSHPSTSIGAQTLSKELSDEILWDRRVSMGRTTSEALAALVGEHVSVITNDGRLLVVRLVVASIVHAILYSRADVTQGKLRGCDHATNVILEDGVERVYSKETGVEVLELGVYVIRGDNIAVVGELDLEKEARTDLALVRGDPLKPIVH